MTKYRVTLHAYYTDHKIADIKVLRGHFSGTGTGLSLSRAKEIVEAMYDDLKGNVVLELTLEELASFYVAQMNTPPADYNWKVTKVERYIEEPRPTVYTIC